MELVSVVRVSTAGQDTEGQIPANERWAAANGHVITRVVPIKASAFKPGSQLSKHLDAIVAERPEGIVMRRVDRLSRKGVENGLATVRRLRQAGIKLYLADIGDASEANEMTLSALFYVAAEESRVKQARTLDNHGVIADRGGYDETGGRIGAWSGLPAYGYTVANSGTLNARLEVSEAEAALVREMFQWCADGASTREIADWLSDRTPTRRGKAAWSQAQVRKMLAHAGYATGSTTLTSTPRDIDGEPIEARRLTWDHHHAPIITRELFDAATASLSGRRNRVTYTRDDTLEALEGALTCSKCNGNGRLYLATQRKPNGKTYQRYQCRVGHGMTRSKAEAAVAERMTGFVVRDVTVTTTATDPRETERAALTTELARTNAATDDGFARIVELRTRIAELESSEGGGQDAPAQTLVWVDASGYATADWAERRRLACEAGITIP